MKNVKFKKWIIAAVVSFILSIILLGITIVVDSSKIVRSINETYYSWDSNITQDIQEAFSVDNESTQSNY